MTRRVPAVAAVMVALALAAALGTGAQAATTARSPAPSASYLQVVNDVMCVVCHEPLSVAQSPEAFQERDYIRGLIDQGKKAAREAADQSMRSLRIVAVATVSIVIALPSGEKGAPVVSSPTRYDA